MAGRAVPGVRNDPREQPRNLSDERLLNALSLVLPGDRIAVNAPHESLALGAGSHGGFTLNQAGAWVRGLSVAVVTRPVRVEADAVLEGLTFFASSDDEMVRVAAGHALFRNCAFTKTAKQTSVHVVNESGATCTFIGCTFYGGGTGNVIDNQGAPADVVVNTCHNATGNPL